MARALRLTWCAAAVLAVLSAGPGWPQGLPAGPQRAEQFSSLVIPVSTGDPALEPLTGPVFDALQQALRAHGARGQALLVLRAGDPAVQRALAEHPYIELPARGPISPALADALGWVLRVDTTISAVLATDNASARLTLRVSGVKSRMAREQTATAALTPEVRAASNPRAVARWASALVEPAVAALAPELPVLAAAAPAAPEEHFREGERLFAQGDYVAAVAEYDMASAANPEEPSYYMALARCYKALGDFPGALLEARRSLRLQPDLIAARVLVGEVYLAQKNLDLALEAFQGAALADPRNADALLGLARAYAAQGQQAMALAQYNRVLALDPKDLDALLAAEGVAEQLGRWKEAGDFYARAAALQPQRADLRRRQVDLYRRHGDLAAAVAALKQAQDAGVQITYDAVQFASLARMMEDEAASIIATAQSESDAALQAGLRPGDPVAQLRQRSDNLALAAGALTPPEPLAPGHKHRVLAFNQLNQSNYELMRYFETRQQDRESRAQLLRDAAQQELIRARGLDTDAGWPVLTAETRAPGAAPAAP